MRTLTIIDSLLCQADHALRILASRAVAARAIPASMPAIDLSATQSRHAAGLMRVNHVGEICAQALYQGQALVSRNPVNRAMLLDAADEEIDHLAWTEQRLTELNSRPSLLNPLWYSGAFALGVIAGRVSEAVSLGFVVETELQVGAHLSGHLDGKHPLPIEDERSRAIVTQMRDEELAHAEHARAGGAVELPNLVKQVMAGTAKVMTTVAYRI